MEVVKEIPVPPRSVAPSLKTSGLGERVRQLRVAASLTQTELAADRFSKEYISQIERGKTRPNAETVAWLAQRLGADPAFLTNGLSVELRARAETELARAEALIDRTDYVEAARTLRAVAEVVSATGAKDLLVRALSDEARLCVCEGRAHEALDLLSRARLEAETAEFTDVDRATILFQMGVCRYNLPSIASAVSLFTEALRLAEQSVIPCDLLRSNILGFRSRCYRRQRDLEAAREDVERALELAEAIESPRRLADALFNASLIAERSGHLIQARSYAERAKAHYETLSDQLNVAKLQNNLGGLHFLLDRKPEAIRYLKDAVATALDLGSDVDAAQAISSLARVHLDEGAFVAAEKNARHALQLLGERHDFLDELGGTHLVLGRALLEQDRLDEAAIHFETAEDYFEQFASASHKAAAWIARGDLAAKRGSHAGAARLYRQAAEALQDVRF